MKKRLITGIVSSVALCLATTSCLAAKAGNPKKLKVFVLAGQSNMVGHSHYRTVPMLLEDNDPGAREVANLILKKDAVNADDVREMINLGFKVGDLKKKIEDRTASDADRDAARAELAKLEPDYVAARNKVEGAFNVSDRVYINSIADRNARSGKLCFGYGGSPEELGPELGFGMSMEKKIDGPILIIKTSWGGKSLAYDFRPPSAGVYPLNEKQAKADDPEYLKQIARDKELYKVWLEKTVKKIKAFWVEHDKFMAANLSKEKYAAWQKEFADWNRTGIEGNGGYANLQPWMVWAPERQAQKYFAGTDIKAPTMNFSKTLWKERPMLADAKTGDEIRAGAGTFYRKMRDQVHAVLKDLESNHPDYDPEAGYEMAGFVWFQGYNDQFSEAYHSNYKNNMIAFINDVRKEFGNSQMPFVIGVLGTSVASNKGKAEVYKSPVPVAQRAVALDPQVSGVKSVESYVYFDHEALNMFKKKTFNKPEHRTEFQRRASDKPYHYMGSGKLFTRLGDDMARAMVEMMKK